MPAIITHDFFGRDLYDKGGFPLGPSMAERQAFLLGNQGPDPLFYAVVLAPHLREFNKLGSIMHHENTAQLLATFRECTDEFTGADWNIARAYSLGFLCHYALDVSMHPLVYFWQNAICASGEEGLSQKDHGEVHAVIESEFDEMVLSVKAGKTIAEFAPQKEVLQASNVTLDVISRLYEKVVKRVWGLDIPEGMFATCVKRFRLTAGVFHSPKGMKRRMIGAVEELVRPYSFCRAMSHRNLPLEESLFANVSHGRWIEPATGNSRNDSFWDIFEGTQRFATELMNAFCEEGFDAQRAEEFVRGRTFDGQLAAK